MFIADSIIARDDTLVGVCYGVAEDFGFNPTYLRILFAFAVFWSPIMAVGGYAALGAIVAFSRLVAPDPRPAAAQAAPPEEEETAGEELPLAA